MRRQDRSCQPEAREGQAGPPGVADRSVVPLKPGNSGGGKGPEFQISVAGAENQESGDEPNTFIDDSGAPRGAARQSEGSAQLSVLLSVRQDLSSRRADVRLRAVPA